MGFGGAWSLRGRSTSVYASEEYIQKSGYF